MHPARFGGKSHGRPDFKEKNDKNESFFPLNFIVYINLDDGDVQYVLRPFVHPDACCCVLLGVVAQSLKPAQTFSYVQTDAMLGVVVAWPTTLRPFALGFSLMQVNEALIQVSKCNQAPGTINFH